MTESQLIDSNYCEIDIATDFSPEPKGKVRKDGPYSAEVFREDILIPAINNNSLTTVKLDGVKKYSNGFLKESFGKLGKVFDYNTLLNKLYVETNNPNWSDEVWRSIDENTSDS